MLTSSEKFPKVLAFLATVYIGGLLTGCTSDYGIGCDYYSSKNYKESIKYFQKAAKNGDIKAQSQIGYMYAAGLGVDKDLFQAIEWYKKAAEQGDLVAQQNLAHLYMKVRNFTEAKRWLILAADKKSLLAAYLLGILYEGIEKNADEAERWYKVSAHKGFSPAQNALAYFWAERNVNLVDAENLIRKALRHEPENSHYLDTLGIILYKQGRYDESIIPLKKAVALSPDNPIMSENLGNTYFMLKDTDNARLYWEKALHLYTDSASFYWQEALQGYSTDKNKDEIQKKLDSLSDPSQSRPIRKLGEEK